MSSSLLTSALLARLSDSHPAQALRKSHSLLLVEGVTLTALRPSAKKVGMSRKGIQRDPVHPIIQLYPEGPA